MRQAWRVDAVEKALGQAAYLDDMDEPEGCLHAALVTSPHPHAMIRSIDANAARAMPGVVAVLDRDHTHGIDVTCAASEYRAGKAPVGEIQVLCVDRVRFDGDLVALVVAQDRDTARAAATAVVVDYELLPAVLNFDDATRPGAPVLHDANAEGNIAMRDEWSWGDLDTGFAAADHVSEHEYVVGNVFHRPIEPTTGCMAVPEGNTLTVWAPLHQPYLFPEHLSPVIGVPAEQIRVQVPFIGGGFGSKHITQAAIATSAMAHALQRPVRYIPSDVESYRTIARHAIKYTARVGADRSGQVTALDVSLDIDTGAYFTGASVVTHNACLSAWGCYAIPHFRVRAVAAYTNKVPSGAFRATGKNTTTFAIESIMDEIALQVGLTPQEVRRRNVVKRGEFVAETWRVNGVECVADVPPLDADLADMVDKAADGIGWAPGSVGSRPDGHVVRSAEGSRRVVRGRGTALSLRTASRATRARDFVRVDMDRTGTFVVNHNAPDLGSGVYTMLAVVAATEMELPVSQVHVRLPDSGNQMPSSGTGAQRTTVHMGNALIAACRNFKADYRRLAAAAKGGDPSEWVYREGSLFRGDDSFGPQDLPGEGERPPVLSAVGSFGRPVSADAAFGGPDHWAAGAAAAEVEVDCDTGEVTILRYCAVADVGKAIHPTSLIRQVEGGAIMGFGSALHEELRYDEHGLVNGDSWSYRAPTMADLPKEFKVVLIENLDGPGPFGAKGAAQTSLPCVMPAIGNAVRDAIGHGIHVMPATPERILATLRLAEEAPSDDAAVGIGGR
jgi:CO/xanthine dehydrogenase Mo-binding subunit